MPNINLNRYSNIRPYQDNIVRINSKNKYINASWVHLPEKYYFIATQGPLDTTIEDFWEMIFGYNVNVIVMLCQLQENNRVKKASIYVSVREAFDNICKSLVPNYDNSENEPQYKLSITKFLLKNRIQSK